MAKRPQHHLQASVPPAPSPVLHQASSCGLHLWPAEKPHRIELCLCQLTILAESEIERKSDSLRWSQWIGSVIVM